MVASVNPVGSQQRQVNNQRAELSAEDFWKLLLTNLQLQDPFQSADMNTMLQQFVTLQAAREMARLSDSLQQVQALLLLGRAVSAYWEGSEVTGTVVGVSLGSTPTLSVQQGDQTIAVPLKSVWQIALSPSANLSSQA